MVGEKGQAVKLSSPVSPVNNEVSTMLDRGSTFEGKITFEGGVVINGRFKGEIFSEGSLTIGKGGCVEGRIEIGSILIQGEVKGDIIAREKIEINAPAVVRGDIATPSLIIQEGALFEGNCSMEQEANQNVVDLASRHAE